ncbi:hypothetical protein LTS08_003305 [Lithohypha guttulata]|nr:hypothetical protein LTS08_003305 [Lithohypha guttulata]
MASFSSTPYHADSDADDEFERSVVASPIRAHTDSETSSEPPSNEHTPTTFGTPFDDGIRPRTIISAWTTEECAQFVASLGLKQYSEQFIEHGIVGEALIALNHEELKEMGVSSAGYRLKILKEVHNIKVEQDVPIEADDYVPPSVATAIEQDKATKDDILKLTNAILRLRDEKIAQLESQLAKLADDSRRLRTEMLPLVRMAKEREPLPYRPHDVAMGSPEYLQDAVMSPTLPAPAPEPEKKTSLTRSFSKKLGLSSGSAKNHSPTNFPGTIPEGKATHDTMGGLQPSAAASAASNQLTAGMQGGAAHSHYSPNPNSPTSPMPGVQHQPLAPRAFHREPASGYTEENYTYRGNPIPTPPLTGIVPDPISNRSVTTIGNKPSTISNASTLIPSREMSASVPPASSAGHGHPKSKESKEGADADDPSVQIFKSFRVALDDPCWKVLPAALRKYNIQADWRQYALYIVYGDQERCVGLEEKPLALFKDLDREGKKPMFMLRKLANGIVGDIPGSTTGAISAIRPGTAGTGIQSSAASVRTMGQEPRMLPGGII